MWAEVAEQLRRFRVVPAVLGALCLFNWSYGRWLKSLFWDFRVYTDSAHGGVGAYQLTSVNFRFVYHPLILETFKLLDRVGLAWVLGTFYGLSAVLFFRAVRSIDRAGLAVLVAACFGGVGVLALGSGNIALFFHLACAAALLVEARRPGRAIRWSWAIIVATSLVKPYFLAYCLVPFLLDAGKLRSKVLACAAAFAVWIGALFAYQAARPDMAALFYRTVSHETLGVGDLGYSFFYWFMLLTGDDKLLSLGLHVLCMAPLVYWLLRLRARRASLRLSQAELVLLGCFFANFVNPRMKEYDAFPAAACLFVFVASRFGEEAIPMFLAAMAVSSLPRAFGVVFRLFGHDTPDRFYYEAGWVGQMVGFGLVLGMVALRLRGRLDRATGAPALDRGSPQMKAANGE